MKKLERSRRKRSIVGAFVSAIGFIGFGLIVLFSADNITQAEIATKDAEEISYISMEEDAVYWIEELTVIDCYATLNEDDVMYYMVSYEDYLDRTVLASLAVNSSQDCWTAMKNYYEDDEAGVGDCVIKGYFKVYNSSEAELEGERKQYFNSCVEKHKNLNTIPLTSVSLKNVLQYKCATYDELVALTQGANTVAKVVGVLSLVIGALALYGGFKWKADNKKLDAQEAAAKAAKASALDDIVNNSGFFTQPTVRRVVTTTPPAQHAAPTVPVAPTQHSTAPTPSTSDKIAKLNEYKAMMDAGYMTPAEFEQKRRELLGL